MALHEFSGFEWVPRSSVGVGINFLSTDFFTICCLYKENIVKNDSY